MIRIEKIHITYIRQIYDTYRRRIYVLSYIYVVLVLAKDFFPVAGILNLRHVFRVFVSLFFFINSRAHIIIHNIRVLYYTTYHKRKGEIHKISRKKNVFGNFLIYKTVIVRKVILCV